MMKRDTHKVAMDKFIMRQNARRYMEFGVEIPLTYGPLSERAGRSNRRHYVIHNPTHAKFMIKENIEVLKLMKPLPLP